MDEASSSSEDEARAGHKDHRYSGAEDDEGIFGQMEE